MEAKRVKELVESLGARADLRGVGSLSEEEQTILVPYWAWGVIGNGGFRYFFEGQHSMMDVARRMKALRLDAQGAACERVALQLFPGGEPPKNNAERDAILDAVDWNVFDEEKEPLFSLSLQELLEALGRYVESHMDGFPAG